MREVCALYRFFVVNGWNCEQTDGVNYRNSARRRNKRVDPRGLVVLPSHGRTTGRGKHRCIASFVLELTTLQEHPPAQRRRWQLARSGSRPFVFHSMLRLILLLPLSRTLYMPILNPERYPPEWPPGCRWVATPGTRDAQTPFEKFKDGSTVMFSCCCISTRVRILCELDQLESGTAASALSQISLRCAATEGHGCEAVPASGDLVGVCDGPRKPGVRAVPPHAGGKGVPRQTSPRADTALACRSPKNKLGYLMSPTARASRRATARVLLLRDVF